jgi:hypothetical protein
LDPAFIAFELGLYANFSAMFAAREARCAPLGAGLRAGFSPLAALRADHQARVALCRLARVAGGASFDPRRDAQATGFLAGLSLGGAGGDALGLGRGFGLLLGAPSGVLGGVFWF